MLRHISYYLVDVVEVDVTEAVEIVMQKERKQKGSFLCNFDSLAAKTNLSAWKSSKERKGNE